MIRSVFAMMIVAVLASSVLAQTNVLSTSAELVLPQYVVNGNVVGHRLQSAFLLNLSGLPASTVTRYTPAGSTSTALDTVNGPGFFYGVTPGGADGTIDGFTSNKNLTGNLLGGNEFTNGSRRAEFTPSAGGNYTGWFSLVPDNNATFAAGNDIYAYVQHNNGSGNQITQSIRTASTLRVLDPTNVTGNARAVAGYVPGVAPEQFVLLYDNKDGSGRPVWSSWTENDGITTNFTTWYNTATNGVDGQGEKFGAYVPTSLSNGIMRIEIRDTTGAIVNSYTSLNGVWFDWVNGGTVDTKLPTPGTTPLFISYTPYPEPGLLMACSAIALITLRRGK